MNCITKLSVLALAAAAFVSAAAPGVRADIFAGSSARTDKKLFERETLLAEKTVVEAYKQNAKKDPKYEAAAVKFLEDFAKTGTSRWDTPEGRTLEREGRLLYLDGCEDPMVLYAYGRSLVARQWYEQAEWFMRRSAETMPSQGYSPIWRASAAARAVANLRTKGDLVGAYPYAQMVIESVPQILKSKDFTKEDRALLISHIKNACIILNTAEHKKVWEEAAKVPDADPVAVLLLEGEYHIAAAWDARGGGWAGSVNEQGWKIFSEELNVAKTALTKAWEIDHTIPEPAAAMISVEMGLSGAQEMRQWFDRAVHGRLDYSQAYEAYIFGLLPRWHGDRQSLLSLGLECFDTRRFDTAVPMKFFDILLNVRDQCDDGDMSGWGRPEVYDRVKELFEKSLDAGGYMSDNQHYRSLEAAFCVQAGRSDEALEVIKKLHGPLLASGTTVVHVTPDEVRGAAIAYGSGAASADANHAAALAVAGNLHEAIDAYELALKNQTDPSAIRRLHSALQVVQWRSDFQDGKTVALKSDRQMSGFHPVIGRWHADKDGSIVGKATGEQYTELMCEANFGDHWELKTRFDYISPRADWDGGGLTVDLPGSANYDGYTADRRGIFTQRSAPFFEERSTAHVTVKDRDNEMILRRDGEDMTVKINGTEVFKGHAPSDSDARRLRVGVGGWPLAAEDAVRYRELTIKKIGN